MKITDRQTAVEYFRIDAGISKKDSIKYFKTIKLLIKTANKKEEVKFFTIPLQTMNIRISTSWFIEDNTNLIRCYTQNMNNEILFKMEEAKMERFIIATIKNPSKAKHKYRKYRIER